VKCPTCRTIGFVDCGHSSPHWFNCTICHTRAPAREVGGGAYCENCVTEWVRLWTGSINS